MRLFSLFCVWLFTTCSLFGQSCPNCLPNGIIPVEARPSSDAHGWYPDPLNASLVQWYWKGELCGTLNPLTGEWHTAGRPHTVNLIRAFGLSTRGKTVTQLPKECLCKPGECECRKCPNDCVAGVERTALPAYATTGVIRPTAVDAETFRVNGKLASEDVALRQISGGSADVPNDGKLPRLVVVGTDAARQAVLNDLTTSPQLQLYKAKVLVQSYDATHQHVAGLYQAFGDISLYLVSPDGKLLTWQSDYTGGPDRLAKNLEAGLRNPDPNFDPKKTPDLSKPKPASPVDGNAALIALCCLGAAGIGLALKK